MDPALLLTGMVVGFLVAAPVGPVAVLCVQRTLADGRLAGYATGVGAGLADAVYGALAVFSVAVVETFLADHRPIVQLGGSLVLIGLGIRTVLMASGQRPAPRMPKVAIDHVTLLHACGSAFVVTMFNPITVVAFLSIFAAIGLSTMGDGLVNSWTVVGGVLVGALGWWWLLASLASVVRQRFTDKGLRWLNAVSGAALITFGLYGLVSLAWLGA